MLIRAHRVRFSTSLSNHLANIQLQKTGLEVLVYAEMPVRF